MMHTICRKNDNVNNNHPERMQTHCQISRLLLASLALLAVAQVQAEEGALPVSSVLTTSTARTTPATGLTLQQAEARMLTHNRELETARRSVGSARAGIDIAAARPNPTITLGISNVDTKLGLRPGYSRIAAISQTLERGGKRDLRLATANALQQAAEASLSDTERTARLAVQEAYWELKLAEERLQRAEESARLARETLDKAELRLQAGDIASGDVARIKADTVRVSAEARTARSDLARSQLALARLLAQEYQASKLKTSDNWPLQSLEKNMTPPGEETLDNWLRLRPDVQAARQQLEATEQNFALAQAQRSRDVTLGLQYELDSYNDRRLGSVNISFPLLLGNDYRGDIAQAMIARDEARAILGQVEASAAADLQLNWETWQQAKARATQLQDEGLPAARRAYASVQLAFEQGAASVLDAIDARRTLLAAELDTASAQADAAKARARLQAALYQRPLP
jgi:cobalt-zinc-cadmium efflux system outer membrane protein